MTYDLRYEPWIPWRRRSGVVEWGAPAALVSQLEKDPVIGLATPRPDFDGAVQEFLIGLLTVALQPADERAWRALWQQPLTVERLQAALDALPPAFDLEGDGPRFFQDYSVADLSDAEPSPIEQILIETPGDQTIRLNKDLFVKRARVKRLGRPAAAMALLTLQTYAPAGGQGHRTSLRGGGPLTTLIDPRVDGEGLSRGHEEPLWQKLWANVETQDAWASRAPAEHPVSVSAVFPWMSATRTSSKGSVPTTPKDAHPLQAYFALPRRIRLEFGGPERCDLTGESDDRTVTGFRMRNYGVQYLGWQHPLSPHYRARDGEDWLPVHGQPGGVGWRDWLSLVLRAPEGGLRQPASVVAAFGRRGADIGTSSVRLQAFGYDMDNMKARGWTDATLPAFAVDDDRQALLYNTASSLTDAAGMTSTALLRAVKTALFQSPDDAGGDLGQVRLDLWAATEREFYDAMATVAASSRAATDAEAAAQDVRRNFAPILLERATEVFDRWCPASGLTSEAMRRRVRARYDLVSTLRGYSKFGEKMFGALGIASPGADKPARAKTRTRKEAIK